MVKTNPPGSTCQMHNLHDRKNGDCYNLQYAVLKVFVSTNPTLPVLSCGDEPLVLTLPMLQGDKSKHIHKLITWLVHSTQSNPTLCIYV